MQIVAKYIPSGEEIGFSFYDVDNQQEHKAYIYPDSVILHEVYYLLLANKAATFEDLPKSIQDAAEEAICSYREGHFLGDNVMIQKNVPEDLIDMFEEYMEEHSKMSDEDIKALKAMNSMNDLLLYIDSKLTDVERKEVAENDLEDLRYGFGEWIRENVIYSDCIDLGLVLDGKSDGERPMDAISDSDKVIDSYKQYLKSRK